MHKILMIGDIDSEKWHATTLQLLFLADGLSYHTQSIEIIIPRRNPKKDFIHFKNKNLKIYRKFSLRRFNILRFFFRIPWIILHAFGSQFDIIYLPIQEKSTHLFLITALKLFSSAHIVCQFDACQKTILKKRALLSGRLAHSIHATTAQLKKELILQGIPAEKIFCVGNGTNTHKIYPLQQHTAFKKFNLAPDYIYVGFAGNLQVSQGVECLLNALAILKTSIPYVKAIIAGDGKELNSLKSLAESLCLTEHVIFFGSIPFKEINLLLNAFDIGIAPLTAQHHHLLGSSPIKIRDYAAAGLPTIATEYHDLKEEAETLTWLTTVKADDPLALAHTMSELIEQTNARKHMRHTARHYAENHFSWKIISVKLLAEITMQIHANKNLQKNRSLKSIKKRDLSS